MKELIKWIQKEFKIMLALSLLLTIILILEQKNVVATSTPQLEKYAEQKIIVKGSKNSKRAASVTTYEKRKGKWVKVHSSIEALVGKNGISKKTKEGDGKTPEGTYLLGKSFGWGNKPNSTYPFRKVTKYDFWIDDVSSKDYNKWIYYKGNPLKRWKSFERLNHPLYKYAVIIRYNENPIIKGKGSAIFLHIKNKSTIYTAGCVSVEEKDLLKIVKWLDQKKKPIIVIKK